MLYKVVLISPAQQPESAVSIHISGLPCLLTGEKICLPMQKMQVLSLGREGPLEKEMATHLSIIAWEMSQTEEPGGLQCSGSQRVGHDLATKQHTYISSFLSPLPTPSHFI